MPGPLCFILLDPPQRPGGNRDDILSQIIFPAIAAARMEPVLARQEAAGMHAVMPKVEQMLLCDFAICDLTYAPPPALLAIGARIAVRPHGTVLLAAETADLHIDASMPVLRYALNVNAQPTSPNLDSAALSKLLLELRDRQPHDMPLQGAGLTELINRTEGDLVASDKTDMFRKYAPATKTEHSLKAARQAGDQAAIDAIRNSLGTLEEAGARIAVDVLLSYRAVKAWHSMIDLIDDFPPQLRQSALVREQLGLALNRAGRGDEAERVLYELIRDRSPSSETLGLLGRVYKDRWKAALRAGSSELADRLLRMAADTYRQGFETDWRDHFPGINAVTLMELQNPPDPARLTLLPVVRYSVERRISGGHADYWDWATLLELAVIGNDEGGANAALDKALSHAREPFERETTAGNLRLICDARRRAGGPWDWIARIATKLIEHGDAIASRQ